MSAQNEMLKDEGSKNHDMVKLYRKEDKQGQYCSFANFKFKQKLLDS